jgi:hypothetical protein
VFSVRSIRISGCQKGDLFWPNWLMGSAILAEFVNQKANGVATAAMHASAKKGTVGSNFIAVIAVNSSLSPVSQPI